MKKFRFSLLLLLIYTLILVGFFINRGEQQVVINKIIYLLGPIISLVAGGITLHRLGWQGKRATVIKYIMMALGLWFLGEMVTMFMILMGKEPYPSLADVFFLIGYGVFSFAVVSEAKLFELNWNRLDRFLLIILCIVFALIVGIVGYISVIGYKPSESLLSNLTTVSWSIGDIIMGGLGLVLLAMMWQYKNSIAKNAWVWFMAATMVNLFADTIYNLNPEAISNGSILTIILDSFWVGAYLLFAGYFLEIYKDIQWAQSKVSDSKELHKSES
ncbi:hypothetical protein A2154_03680 [Candidatus Gottesmanbacteria bacterium RBG_16_43_7]|uniref:Uncharacterized protein n=1 Tax=Candidatus Gottesmanbacteria bacterium RBG_16_43_7 TaxID=1798373 RepID=A0A1F5Z913_9BACT|nr:MAG: hypothetical protein A2154_03680 [Candidatus Gottesmanbacteria bacterium RBG_16_43_7]